MLEEAQQLRRSLPPRMTMQRASVWTLVSAILVATLAASGVLASDIRPGAAAAGRASQVLTASRGQPPAAASASAVAALAEIDEEEDDEVALSPAERRRIAGGDRHRARARASAMDMTASLDVEAPAAPQTERFAESEATLVEAAAAGPKTCPRWGQLKKPDGEAPVPRMGGFGFIMRNNAGVAQFVVGAGVKRSGSLVRKIRYMSLGENGGSKWVRPAVGRGAGATQVWRNAAAYAWFPSPSLRSGTLFEFGGTAANDQGAVQLVDEPRALLADAANEAGTFRWVAPTLTDPESKGIKPLTRQGATLTPVPGGRAVLFGGALESVGSIIANLQEQARLAVRDSSGGSDPASITPPAAISSAIQVAEALKGCRESLTACERRQVREFQRTKAAAASLQLEQRSVTELQQEMERMLGPRQSLPRGRHKFKSPPIESEAPRGR